MELGALRGFLLKGVRRAPPSSGQDYCWSGNFLYFPNGGFGVPTFSLLLSPSHKF